MFNKFGNVGQKIKKIRQEKNYTLKDMVEYTGLSLGYLSNLERNINSPTLDALNRICTILDVELVTLLTEKTPVKRLLRSDERKIDTYPSQLLTRESIRYPQLDCAIDILTLKAGKPQEMPFWRHNFNEICLVLQGELIVLIEGKSYHLKTGDSLAVDKDLQHAMLNPTEEVCVSQWIHGTFSQVSS